MNRGRQLKAICAGLACACACASTAALARDNATPTLSIDPVVARNLLAPIEDARTAPAYRLDPRADPVAGQRARLSIDVGKATMFAITGRIRREPAPAGPLEPGDTRLLGQRHDSGKVYGGGISTNFHGVDLAATYQYSKVSAERGDSEAAQGTLGRSHSLRATARFRFKR